MSEPPPTAPGEGPLRIPPEMKEPAFAEGCVVRGRRDGLSILFYREAVEAEAVEGSGPTANEAVAHIWVRPERFHLLAAYFKLIVEQQGGSIG
jgi:hypothetical protein